MTLNDFLRRTTGYYNSRAAVYLESAPGRGKTRTIMAAVPRIAKALNKNLGLVVVNGGSVQPMDAIGFGLPKTTEEYAEMIFSKPFWWTTSEGKRLEQYDGGVIFVDEADKMDVDLKKIIGEAAYEGRLGPHFLPNGWVMWFAGNGAKHRSGSTKELDHLISRQLRLTVTDDMQSLLDWADRTNQPYEFKTFVATHSDVVFTSDVPEKQGPWCTPRSLELMMNDQNEFRVDGRIDYTDRCVIEEIAGRIGQTAGETFTTMLRLEEELPAYADIIADPMNCRVPVKPDGKLLAVYNLSQKVGKKDAQPILTYIQRYGKEFATTFCKSAINRDQELVNVDAFDDWLDENASLLAAIIDVR